MCVCVKFELEAKENKENCQYLEIRIAFMCSCVSLRNRMIWGKSENSSNLALTFSYSNSLSNRLFKATQHDYKSKYKRTLC